MLFLTELARFVMARVASICFRRTAVFKFGCKAVRMVDGKCVRSESQSLQICKEVLTLAHWFYRIVTASRYVRHRTCPG